MDKKERRKSVVEIDREEESERGSRTVVWCVFLVLFFLIVSVCRFFFFPFFSLFFSLVCYLCAVWFECLVDGFKVWF